MSNNIDVSHPWFLKLEFIQKKKKKMKKAMERVNDYDFFFFFLKIFGSLNLMLIDLEEL